MKPKKIPMRMCVGCREMKPKRELIRVVRSPEGEVSMDATGKKPGRGAYLCRDAACLARALKQKQLERQLEVQLTPEVVEQLQQTLANLPAPETEDLLGLCARAGQIAFGEDGCLGAIRTGKCGLLILDQGASANARKRYTDACRYYRVPLATAAAGLVEQSTGKRGRMAAAIARGGFADQLRATLGAQIPGQTIEETANNCGGASVE